MARRDGWHGCVGGLNNMYYLPYLLGSIPTSSNLVYQYDTPDIEPAVGALSFSFPFRFSSSFSVFGFCIVTTYCIIILFRPHSRHLS